MNNSLLQRLSTLVGVFSVVLLVAALALTTFQVTQPKPSFRAAECDPNNPAHLCNVSLSLQVYLEQPGSSASVCDRIYKSGVDIPASGARVFITDQDSDDSPLFETTTSSNGFASFTGKDINFTSDTSAYWIWVEYPRPLKFRGVDHYPVECSVNAYGNERTAKGAKRKITKADFGSSRNLLVVFHAQDGPATGPSQPAESPTTTPTETPSPTPEEGAQCPNQEPPNKLSDCGDSDLYNVDPHPQLTIDEFTDQTASLSVTWDDLNTQQYRVAIFYYVDGVGGMDPNQDGQLDGDYALAGWRSLIKVNNATSTTITQEDFDTDKWAEINLARAQGKTVQLVAVVRAIYHSTDEYVSDPQQCSCRSYPAESEKQTVPSPSPTLAPTTVTPPSGGPNLDVFQVDVWGVRPGRPDPDPNFMCYIAWDTTHEQYANPSMKGSAEYSGSDGRRCEWEVKHAAGALALGEVSFTNLSGQDVAIKWKATNCKSPTMTTSGKVKCDEGDSLGERNAGNLANGGKITCNLNAVTRQVECSKSGGPAPTTATTPEASGTISGTLTINGGELPDGRFIFIKACKPSDDGKFRCPSEYPFALLHPTAGTHNYSLANVPAGQQVIYIGNFYYDDQGNVFKWEPDPPADIQYLNCPAGNLISFHADEGQKGCLITVPQGGSARMDLTFTIPPLGNLITKTVSVTDAVTDLWRVRVSLVFDHNKVEIIDQNPLVDGDQVEPLYDLLDIRNGQGQILENVANYGSGGSGDSIVYEATLINDTTPVSGTGGLFKIHYKLKAPVTGSPFQIMKYDLLKKDGSPAGGAVNVEDLGGTVPSERVSTDINADGYIDGADVAAVVASYGAVRGEDEYNAAADFCGPSGDGSDGIINAYEVSCLIRDWNPR